MTDNNNKQDEAVLEHWAKDWKVFLQATILLPLLLALILMLVQSFMVATDLLTVAVSVATTLMLSLISGFLGTKLEKAWAAEREQSVLLTRGESAVRGLTIISNQVAALSRKSKECQEWDLIVKGKDIEIARKAVMLSHSEIQDRCRLLQEAILNARQEWEDILPGYGSARAVIKALLVVEAAEEDVRVKDSEIVVLKEQIANKETSDQEYEQEVNALYEELKDKEKELASLRASLAAEKKKARTVIETTPPSSIPYVRGTADILGDVSRNFIDSMSAFKIETPRFLTEGLSIGSFIACPHCGTSNPYSTVIGVNGLVCSNCGKSSGGSSFIVRSGGQ